MSQYCIEGFIFKENYSKKGANDILMTSVHTITTYPVNENATLGSLYDGVMDRVLTNPFINESLIKREPANLNPDCEFISINKGEQNNLLKRIGIRENLRLSIALELTSVTDGILMLHNYEFPVNDKIRLIYYSCVCQRESLIHDVKNVTEHLKTLPINKNATHIITNTERGLDFAIILQYPTNSDHYELDNILNQLCLYFKESNGVFLTTENQQKINILKPIILTSINEIQSISKFASFSEVCQRIYHIVRQTRNFHPLTYTMHPVKCVYDENLFEIKAFQQADRTIVDKLEEIWLPLSNEWKRIKILFSNNQTGSPQNVIHFIEQIQDDFKKVEQIFNETRKVLGDIVTTLRKGHTEVNLYGGILDGSIGQPLNSKLKILSIQTRSFHTIINLINQLKIERSIEYVNVVQLETHGDTLENVEKKLLSTNNGSFKCYLCFTHELINNGFLENQKAELYRQINVSTQLVLADFSTCKCRSPLIKILSTPIHPLVTNQNHVQAKEINILLVGETGVGKSTFINAFVNYLAYQTLQQAVNSKPIVLIPVSFIITTGDEFTEHTIQFGQMDSNERHQQAGESVTQNCKSYLFTINNDTKLRIIDTPGFGDTRGVQQDDKNIEQVLSYVSNLSHLNAICFLLKPDVSRLHVLFRSYFTQIFHYLGPNARDNVTFCFTNTRATFYMPGNTATLLKELLQQLPNNHTPAFAKSNIFCFDSESFRYLAVIKAGHQLDFDEQQKLDFEKSWTMSKNESNRLLKYIKTRSEYQMNQWQSIKHAQIQIKMLARPMLETLRNVIQNLVLLKLVNERFILELKIQPFSQMEWICPNGSFTINQLQTICFGTPLGQKLHIANDCPSCHCSLDAHLPKFYEVQFESSFSTYSNIDSILIDKKLRLFNGCVILSQFLLNTAQASDNPFIRWIDLFIKEQEYIRTTQYANAFNTELFQNLHQIRNQYQDSLVQMLANNGQHHLDIVYQCVQNILEYPEVLEQMNAIRKTQANMMKNSECNTSVNFNLN